MNEIKKNLKLFTLLATLLAGNIAFAPFEGGDGPSFHEPIHEDPVEAREREAREARETEQQRIEQEQALKNESLLDTAKRKAKSAVASGKAAAGKAASAVTGLFRKPEPVRRSTGETGDDGEPMLSPDESAAPDKDFVMVDHEPAAKSAADLTTEEVEKLTTDDVKKFTQRDIRDLSTDIANLSPEAFESLSAAQTVAMTADQLTLILSNPELLSRLKIENVNPTELSKVLAFRNNGAKFPDEFVERLTKDQIKQILKDNPARLNEYFNDKQIAEMKSKVSLKDQANRGIQKAVNWLNSTTVVKWLNKIGNSGRAERQATGMARSKANGNFDSTQQAEFESNMKDLSTKGKERVANTWAETRIAKVKELEKQLKTAETSRGMDKERTNLQAQLTAETTAMDSEMIAFGKELQTTVGKNEVVIPLKTINDGSPTSRTSRVFEIVDMSKIDPTKSIQEQYADLKSSGFFGRDATVSHVQSGDLLQNYGSWVAKQITIDPSQPIADQLETQAKTATGKSWSELDPSIKVAIFVRLDADIQARFEQDAQDKNATGVARDKKELEDTVLAMNGDEISDLSTTVFQELDPSVIARFSKEQIQGLTLPQIEELSPEQISALDFTQLRSVTIERLLNTMPAEKIGTLTKEQLQTLPKGKLSATLAKLSIADLQTVEAAFKTAKNPFEVTVSREIARKASNAEPVDSYKGDFDNHRITINNAEILNTRTENIGTLSLDVVRDLDGQTASQMTDAQVNAFTKEQLNVLGKDAINAIIPRLAPTAIADLSPEAVSTITPTVFAKLTPTILEDLTPQQAEVVTKPQLDKLNNKQRNAAAKAIDKYSLAQAKALGLDLNEPLKGKGKRK